MGCFSWPERKSKPQNVDVISEVCTWLPMRSKIQLNAVFSEFWAPLPIVRPLPALFTYSTLDESLSDCNNTWFIIRKCMIVCCFSSSTYCSADHNPSCKPFAGWEQALLAPRYNQFHIAWFPVRTITKMASSSSSTLFSQPLFSIAMLYEIVMHIMTSSVYPIS